MDRRERTRTLVEAGPQLVGVLANKVELSFDVHVVKEPVQELVMLKAREGAQRSLFYLGEALMTTCTVRIENAYGHGMLLGEQNGYARALAIVDAAYALDATWCAQRGFDERIEREAERLAQERRREQELLLGTRVDFSTMEVGRG